MEKEEVTRRVLSMNYEFCNVRHKLTYQRNAEGSSTGACDETLDIVFMNFTRH